MSFSVFWPKFSTYEYGRKSHCIIAGKFNPLGKNGHFYQGCFSLLMQFCRKLVDIGPLPVLFAGAVADDEIKGNPVADQAEESSQKNPADACFQPDFRKDCSGLFPIISAE